MKSVDLYMSEEALTKGTKLDIGRGQWLMVLYLYSDEAASRMDAIDREHDNDMDVKVLELKRASLITGWSLDDEITPDGVIALCKRNPRIRKLIDNAATSEAGFFDHAPNN